MELSDPWFREKSPHEIVVFCQSLQIGRIESTNSETLSPASVEQNEIDTQGLLRTIMTNNLQLRQAISEFTVDPSASVPDSSPVAVPDLQRLLLVNEVNFELCMRQYYMQHISKLKKAMISEEIREADREGVYAKLKFQTQELTTTQQALERHRHEAATVRERQRKHEDDLTKRLRAARDQVNALREKADSWKGLAEEREKDVDEMRKEVLRKEACITDLQSELELTLRDTERLRECESALDALTKRMMEGDTPNKDALAAERANITGQLRALELQIESASHEISNLKDSLASSTASCDAATARSEDLERSVTQLESDLESSRKALEKQRAVSSEHIKAVEATYRIAKGLNAQLQAKIVDLHSELEEACSKGGGQK
ncbi:hypothetical protein HK097_003443 [Rhizophlyctis rosea]|uniref:Uncharacterized protein n=1 Tax=Rhizophlyctis rosea TaxID=64517 RepID=A0AAD5X6T3_9FUNG|nr:hypothetical protein HK097_003443 [Rhizophlyctis rosea]